MGHSICLTLRSSPPGRFTLLPGRPVALAACLPGRPSLPRVSRPAVPSFLHALPFSPRSLAFMLNIWPRLFSGSPLRHASARCFLPAKAQPRTPFFPRVVPITLPNQRFFASHTVLDAMETVDTSHRLAELRRLMKERNIDIYGTFAARELVAARVPWTWA